MAEVVPFPRKAVADDWRWEKARPVIEEIVRGSGDLPEGAAERVTSCIRGHLLRWIERGVSSADPWAGFVEVLAELMLTTIELEIMREREEA